MGVNRWGTTDRAPCFSPDCHPIAFRSAYAGPPQPAEFSAPLAGCAWNPRFAVQTRPRPNRSLVPHPARAAPGKNLNSRARTYSRERSHPQSQHALCQFKTLLKMGCAQICGQPRHDASIEPPRRQEQRRTSPGAPGVREADRIILATLASWRFYYGILAVVSAILALARNYWAHPKDEFARSAKGSASPVSQIQRIRGSMRNRQ
jgi:hypothetical protein